MFTTKINLIRPLGGKKTIRRQTRQRHPLFTLLSDVVEALLLNGLVIYETLDFGGGAINIGILVGGKQRQDICQTKQTLKTFVTEHQAVEFSYCEFRGICVFRYKDKK